MSLIVIVGDYNTFISKASLRRIDEINILVAAQFKTIGIWYNPSTYCGCLQRLLAKQD